MKSKFIELKNLLMRSLISIVLPVFNAEKYVKTAIQSVLNQSHDNWELLIINDGSSDNSRSIIESFQKDSRINYFEQENKGVSSARNIGLNNMKGGYFCFLDADDTLPPNSLKDRLTLFENDDVRFVDGSVRYIDEEDIDTGKIWSPNPTDNLLNDLISLKGNVFFGLSWMIRNNKKNRILFEETLTHGEDLWFFIQQAKLDGKYAFTNSVIYNYRKHDESAMANLEKLANGYHQIGGKIKADKSLNHYYKAYKKKTDSILLKSFLRRGNLIQALKYI